MTSPIHAPNNIGSNAIRRLRLKIEGDRLEMRTTVNFLAVLFAFLVSTLASLPFLVCLEIHAMLPPESSGWFAPCIVVIILGCTLGGGGIYIAAAMVLRRHIVLDRARRQVFVNGRLFHTQQDISHVEWAPGLLGWSPLLLRLTNSGRIVLLRSQVLNRSMNEAGKIIADFLSVPYKDYSEGDYNSILALKLAGDRLELRPPNEALARWISYIVGSVLAIGALVFAWIMFPRATGHEMQGVRGLGYIVFGAYAGVHFLMVHLFHRRIVLDRNQGVRVGWRIVCPLSTIDHVGLHMGKNYDYHMSLVQAGGREIPLFYYGGRPPTISETAKTIAGFLLVPVKDYHAAAIAVKDAQKSR